MARPVGRDIAGLKLLLGYAQALRSTQTLATPQVRQLAVSHVYDLIAVALGLVGDAGEVAGARAPRAARLAAIKAEIEENLCREDLSVATLAARHRLPVRYVRRLFEEDGMTFGEFVLGRRLVHARQILVNPRRAHQKISMVALEAGFNNLSYFNETFRRRYGATPSDVRGQARVLAERKNAAGFSATFQKFSFDLASGLMHRELRLRRRALHRGDAVLHRLLHLLEGAHLDLPHALA